MRVLSFTCLCAAGVGVFTACSEEPRVFPLAASWLEWSDSVAAGTQFGVRVYGLIGAEPRNLRFRVRVDRDTVIIEPYSVAPPPCRGFCSPPPGSFGFDTVVWVPAIDATSPRTVTIRAPSQWQAVDPPWPVRTFGTTVVTPDTPTVALMHSVGVGSGFQDSFGCFLVIPGPPHRVYVSADQSPTWAPGFTGFVYGRVDLFLQSTCLDDARVILVDSIKQ